MNELDEIIANEIGGLTIQLARAQVLLAQKDAQIAELEKALATVEAADVQA